MNAAICPRCTVSPRVVGWPYCHECAWSMSDHYGPRGKEPLDYATS